MLRFLWKCVLEVLPPTCATVVAGMLLSAYHEHIVGLQGIIDPRASLEQVATPAPEVSKQQQAVVERPAELVETGGKSPTPGPDADSPLPAREGDPADGKTSNTSETKAPEVADTKAAQGAPTDAQAAQLNAVLMASSPMSQPPAEIKAAQPPVETKGSEAIAAASEGAAADAQSVGPGDPAPAIQPTDVSPTAAKPGAVKSPDTQAVTPVLQPHPSRHVAKPVRKGTVVKMDSGRVPSPVVAMVPLPPPAAPPTVTMEPPPQVSPSRAVLPSHALPPPQPPAPPQAIGPTPPEVIGPMSSSPTVPNPGMAGAIGPTRPQSLPGAPQAGVNSSQEGVAKTAEPTRVFGVPIPPTIVAVGGALDPRPVFSAGQKAIEKIVTTAKSVVPDFAREP
jgi:hypothetical protein